MFLGVVASAAMDSLRVVRAFECTLGVAPTACCLLFANAEAETH
jgi:hypothetical protein